MQTNAMCRFCRLETSGRMTGVGIDQKALRCPRQWIHAHRNSHCVLMRHMPHGWALPPA